jgi:hypothetical protein
MRGYRHSLCTQRQSYPVGVTASMIQEARDAFQADDNDPVVVAASMIGEARAAFYAADDAHDWPAIAKFGARLTSLEIAEIDTAPTSNAGAALKLRGVAADVRMDPCTGSEDFARSAVRLAGQLERGAITPVVLQKLRASVPFAERNDREVGSSTVKAIRHAIAWCGRLRVV